MRVKNTHKVLYGSILITIMCIMLMGCGKIADKKELISYANENYGECTLVDEEASNDKRTIYLKDKEYGFEYFVSSYMDNINIDNSYFGSKQAVGSSFTKEYLKCFSENYKEQISNLEDRYECNIEINKNYNSGLKEDALIFLSINFDVNKDVLTNLNKCIKKYDTRNYLKNGIIYIKQNEGFKGKYILKDEIYKTKSESNTDWALSTAFKIMKYSKDIDIDDEGELEFLYSEELDVHDIYGIENETLAYRIEDTDESLKNTTVWHYSYKGEEWIIADCIVEPEGNLYVHKL